MNELYLSILKQFISFKSISTDKSFKPEIDKTASFLKNLFEENKFKSEIIEGFGNPIVLAEYISDENLETCLIYGHYDVQPAEKSDGWKTEPFELVQDAERLYARGVIDNKGQTLVHMVTIFELIKENKLKYNIKFMLEGDEESGSAELPEFVEKYKDKLACDFYMISDGPILGKNPVLESGFRGGANTTLTFKTAKTDLHSGMYGGGVPNSAHELSKFVSKLFGENDKVLIPGFYDNVDEIPSEILENNKSIPFSAVEQEKITGVKEIVKDPEFDYYSATSLRPTIQVTGIKSGYTADGYRNSISAESTVKINFRLVKNQKPEEILKKYEDFIKANIPSYVSYTLKLDDLHEGVKLDLNNKFVEDAKQKLEEAFGEKCYFIFSGGGLPIVTLFDENLKVPGVLVPLINEDCNMHAVDENYDLDILEKALEFSEGFFGAIGGKH